jgi:hypothetical protein
LSSRHLGLIVTKTICNKYIHLGLYPYLSLQFPKKSQTKLKRNKKKEKARFTEAFGLQNTFTGKRINLILYGDMMQQCGLREFTGNKP